MSKKRPAQTSATSPDRVAARSRRIRFASNSVGALIVSGFGLLVIILAAVVTGSALMLREHRDAISEMEAHSKTASLLQETRLEAGNAAMLLQRMVMANDQTLVPEIRASTMTAVEGLHTVADDLAARGDTEQAETIGKIATSSDLMAAAVEQIISLQQSGDTQRAAAILEAIVPQFRNFRLTLGDAAAVELAAVSQDRSDADRAGDMARTLLIGSGLAGGVLALAAAFLVARSILKPLAALERAARAIGGGDLETRIQPSGPRELAHLGGTLNTMATHIQERENDIRLSNQELKDRNRQLLEARAQAATDALTSLPNHRSFHEAIRNEVKAVEKNGGAIGVIMMDVDGFKGINDSLGHLHGDEVLRHCADIFAEIVDHDCIYRYGGDEFAVLLPGADEDATMETAERLRHAVAEDSGGGPNKVTVSLGVAAYPGTATSAEEIIYEADAAMYSAKSSGKNKVMRWNAVSGARDAHRGLYSAQHDSQLQDVTLALMAALSAKDPATHAHCQRCSRYVGDLALELGLSPVDHAAVMQAALLHDIGKLAVADSVLFKPGPLNAAEWVEMRQHPAAGHHVLSQVPSVASALPAVLHHHEHYDGSGYPHGLAGDGIPLASRILLVADAFDSMTSNRPYRSAMPVEDAIAELVKHKGTQFDPAIVDAFIAIMSRGHGEAPNATAESGGNGARRAAARNT